MPYDKKQFFASFKFHHQSYAQEANELELAGASLTHRVSGQKQQTEERLKFPSDPLERARMIRRLRLDRNLNQMEFADLVGIRFSTYTTIEGGAEPTPQMLRRIAKELNCEV